MFESEQDIINLVKKDAWMMSMIEAAKMLHLPDWWICAGFIRSKVWIHCMTIQITQTYRILMSYIKILSMRLNGGTDLHSAS
ncbi:nucleotidyltransferase family protein [Bacillus sp. NTK074B]|uniref:nucleotidyltransferase family protein n=1 Tax=Bacillus sp. NTK074B TaxID=2802174 RepID=UPI001A8C8DC7|nr:nucleotidyltransferase family protein [Bacillus sp. NTK074B]